MQLPYTVFMHDLLNQGTSDGAITVSELNRQARTLLERGLERLWVAGEISNLARPASGHLYFSLKDASAQIRCAWFRQRQRASLPAFRDGDQMLVLGRVSLYEARGDYQLIVEQIEPAGEGELRRRFEALKKKLAAEGLFDAARKRSLPALPTCIGVITSPSGAAIRDILTVLRRRFPAVPVIVYPSAVQGDAAVPELLAALDAAARRGDCDVLIIGRGGGSLEDLQAFNDESLARAISTCPVPVISAVGHEVDITIADMVADARAPTPSGAAELVVPDQLEWQRSLRAVAAKLAAEARRALQNRFQSVDWLARRLNQASPARRLRQQATRLGELRKALAVAMRLDFSRRGRATDRLLDRFLQHSPASRLRHTTLQFASLRSRVLRAGALSIELARRRLRHAERALNAVSPLATLKRGYAIVTDAESGALLIDAEQTREGRVIRARLARGSIRATVTKTGRQTS
jgi:exodeoxyribonuclease VII large subunit